MAILLAVLSSITIGGADFLGGLTARRAPAITVVFTAHLAGLGVTLVAAPLWGSDGTVTADLLWGAAAGASGAIGLVMLYHALATTRFSVAAPAAALFGAVLSIGYGLVIGERPDALAWVGVVLALPALLLITSSQRNEGGDRRSARRAVLLGALAGIGFSLYGIFMSRTGDSSGLWPLVGSRVASIPAVAVLALARRRPLLTAPPVLARALTVGVLDMGANILFLEALHRGFISLVVLISSLYPAFTVLLARVVLDERIGRRQGFGLLLAGAGIVLIAVA